MQAAGRLIQGGRTEAAPPLSPDDPAWARAPAARLTLTPQRSIAPGMGNVAALPVEVKVLTGAGQLALRLAWRDASEDRVDRKATHRFADAAAVQFPADAAAGLPYIGMGEPRRPVNLWFWRAGGTSERLAANGFGTLAPAPDTSSKTQAPETQAQRGKDGWQLVLRGPLPSPADPLVLALAVWDGAEEGRDGRKRLSPWFVVRLPGLKPDPAQYRLLKEEARVSGKPERGRQLVAGHGCAGCHTLSPDSAATLAPSLLQAGNIHWPGYLRRSVTDPSGFIVPGAGHTAGAGVSLMPKETWSPEALEDLVAYLMTLQ
ncbi:MAG: ethylbenzene dehydrogenase-related protein [Thiobacillus sp.]|nr:ethylbenzene dehydrogenase-related protein [Thiobacillus sp.]